MYKSVLSSRAASKANYHAAHRRLAREWGCVCVLTGAVRGPAHVRKGPVTFRKCGLHGISSLVSQP